MLDVEIKIDSIDYEQSFRNLFPQLSAKCVNMETDHLLVRFLNKMGSASMPVVLRILNTLPERSKGELLCCLANFFRQEFVQTLNGVLKQDVLGQCFQLGSVLLKQADSNVITITFEEVSADYGALLKNDTMQKKIAEVIRSSVGDFLGDKLVKQLAEKGTSYMAALAKTMPGISEKIILSVFEQEKTVKTLLNLAENGLKKRGVYLSLGGATFQQSNKADHTDETLERQKLNFSWELEESLLDSISAYLKSTTVALSSKVCN